MKTGFKTPTQLPGFCYQITISNATDFTVFGIQVTDDHLDLSTCNFPDSLPAHGIATCYVLAEHDASVTNTVTAIGTREGTTDPTTNSTSAIVNVAPASIACTKIVSSPDDLDGLPANNHVTLPADGDSHPVTFRVIVRNTGSADLRAIRINDPLLIARGCAAPPQFVLLAGATTNITLCTLQLACDELPLDNTVTVTGKIKPDSGECGTDINGETITVSSTCSASVDCGNASCVQVSKSACIISQPPSTGTNGCTGGAIALTLEYTGSNITTAATVVITGSDGATVTYNLTSLMSGDILTLPGENGFTIDATAHAKSKLGSKTTIAINGVVEVLHTSCSCRETPDTNLRVCNPVCLDSSSPDNDTGQKGPGSPLWTLISLKDPTLGVQTCDQAQPPPEEGCSTTFSSPECVNVRYIYVITNTGDSAATNIHVVDDQLGELTVSPIASLAPQQSLTLTGTATVCCSTTNTVTVTSDGCSPARAQAIISKCSPVSACTVPYPFPSANPRTSIVFNESEVLRAFAVAVTNDCAPKNIQVFYNDEHALVLGVRRVIVKNTGSTTTNDYPVSPLNGNPGSVVNPQVGSTIQTGGQAGTDVSGRPMFPSLFITDITTNANDLSGDWQFGGIPIPPDAVFGTWKAAVKTVDHTHAVPTMTVIPDDDPPKNDWNLGAGSDPLPDNIGTADGDHKPKPPKGPKEDPKKPKNGLVNQGYGAEARWDVTSLGLVQGHTYRVYFMVHDGDQNKSGGDVGHACAILGAGREAVCPPPPPPRECDSGIVGFKVKYTGEDLTGNVTIEFQGTQNPIASVTYTFPNGLANGTVLTLPAENGFTIDATAHSASKLGTKTSVLINGVLTEVLHTSCSCNMNNFIPGLPACLDSSSPDNPTGDKGEPSPLFLVLDFK
jgi:hypothetical protein